MTHQILQRIQGLTALSDQGTQILALHVKDNGFFLRSDLRFDFRLKLQRFKELFEEVDTGLLSVFQRSFDARILHFLFRFRRFERFVRRLQHLFFYFLLLCGLIFDNRRYSDRLCGSCLFTDFRASFRLIRQLLFLLLGCLNDCVKFPGLTSDKTE